MGRAGAQPCTCHWDLWLPHRQVGASREGTAGQGAGQGSGLGSGLGAGRGGWAP